MIVCTRCGFHNEDSDTFCGSCAGFLEWSGQQVVAEETPAPAPEPAPEADPEHAGFMERVKDRIGIGDAKEGDPAPAGAVAAVPVSVPAAGGPAPAGSPAPAGPPPAPVASAPTASAAPAGVASPPEPPVMTPEPLAARVVQPEAVTPDAVTPAAVQPEAVQPEAVKPSAVKARPTPRSKAAPTRVVNPGDLVCGQCGDGNEPSRKFCRRCGASLQKAEVFTLPWHTRMWRKLTTRKTRQAGERPKNRRRAIGGSGPGWLTSWFTRILVLVIILLVIAAFVGPWRHSIRHALSRGDHDVHNAVHETFNPVHPISATATSSAPGHGPGLAIDGGSNTSWQTGAAGDGVGQSLKIRLATTTNVDKIGFLIGDTDTPQAYVTEPRPESIRVTFNGVHPYTKDITLKDTPSFQTTTVKAKDAASLTITIDSVYPSSQGTHAAITEVELFKES
jgi:hypothetical protein